MDKSSGRKWVAWSGSVRRSRSLPNSFGRIDYSSGAETGAHGSKVCKRSPRGRPERFGIECIASAIANLPLGARGCKV